MSDSSSSRGITVKTVVLALLIIAVLIVSATIPTLVRIDGNEIGVLETMDGVDPKPLQPGWHFWANGIGKRGFPYTTSGQVFVMNSKPNADEAFANGRRVDTLEVKSFDNQPVHFNIILNWHINPLAVVQLHQSYRDNIEERLIRSEVTQAVVKRATVQTAIDVYSGPKFNELREQVEAELKDPAGRLATSGVLVDRFVIEKPQLSPEYEKVIESRQLAIATESAATEQQKANLAMAEAARTKALAKQNEDLVVAETAKQQEIKKQEAISQKAIIEAEANAKNLVTIQKAESEKVVVAAEAEAARQIAISNANKQAEVNRAVGIEAIGRAEGEAQKLRLMAYAVPGSESFTRIEVAKSMALAFQGVRGYLPAGMTVNLLAQEYEKGVTMLVNGGGSTPAAK